MQPVTADALTVDRDGLVALTRRMVQTPSLSGEEGPVARIVAEAMQAVGLADVSIDPLHNVVGYVYGRRPEPELLFNGHIDHVPPGEAPAPYSGEIVDGARFGVTGEVLIGRGACDMKGAVAAMLHAVKSLKEGGAQFHKTFVMTAVAREEMARGEGILYLLERCGLSARMAVSGEATGLQIHLGHRGKLEFTIRVLGRTAHASNPARGINAVYQMCDFIQDLRTDYRLPAHPVLGPCTLAVLDIVSGPGRLGPITPDRCEIALDRRYLPEESAMGVQRELEALIAARRRQHPEFKAEVALVKDFPPFYCPPEASVVQLAQDARRAALGAPGELGVWRFGVDGTFIHRAGIPCVGFGPGDERWAHTPDEHVPLADLEAACRCYAEIIRRACC